MNPGYWLKQSPGSPLFPDIEWNKPEQRARAGKLAIIGGNKLGFVAVANAYQEAYETGAGQIRSILPDALKNAIPPTILDTLLVSSNPSGGMSQDSLPDIKASIEWADTTLLIGDTGRNSETAIVLEAALDSSKPLVVTRDAIDLLRAASQKMVEKPTVTLVLSFAQLQKLFQSVYYPKMLSFSMQLTLLVETLHKFTITYPAVIVTFHQNQLIIAQDGKVATQEYDNPMLIWRGSTATRIACYQLWSLSRIFEASVAACAP